MSKIGKINISIPEKVKVLLSGNNINIEGPQGKKTLNIDLDIFDLNINEGKEVTMTIPVRFEGNAPGVRNQGGNLSKNKRKLSVRALPKDLPDYILANISSLNLNDKITISDVSE